MHPLADHVSDKVVVWPIFGTFIMVHFGKILFKTATLVDHKMYLVKIIFAAINVAWARKTHSAMQSLRTHMFPAAFRFALDPFLTFLAT